MSTATDRLPANRGFLLVVSFLAVGLPTLFAFSIPPSSTFLNQAAALFGWAVFCFTMAPLGRWPSFRQRGMAAAVLVLLVVLAFVAAAVGWQGLPSPLGLSAAAMILIALLVLLLSAGVATAGNARLPFEAFCWALVAAGVASALMGLVQVLVAGLSDGVWLAAPSVDGRAGGNLRQPNHLSTLLLWSIVSLVWLAGERKVPMPAVLGIGALFIAGLVASASRTGLVGVVLLALWGAADGRLKRGLRIALAGGLIAYLLFLFGLSALSQLSDQAFAGQERFSSNGDISSSRFAIWANTLQLIRAYPWFGVGFGEFNFAWSLASFPDRPVAFFDHTHNLILQFAVELGIPGALLLTVLLGFVLFVLGRQAWSESGTSIQRAAFVAAMLIALHSQLEYPLWYSYFLLPTAFVLGVGLVHVRGEEPEAVAKDGAGSRRRFVLGTRLASAVVLGGTLFAVNDYLVVSRIFSDSPNQSSLAERIAEGRRSVFFAHHAHYAAATTAAQPSQAFEDFDGAVHYLLDTRLMMAWARAHAEVGDVDRARHLAARLREFRNADAKTFFEPCALHAGAPDAPFQCAPPGRSLNHLDFLRAPSAKGATKQ